MAKLSHSEIYQLALDAGFNRQDAQTMTSIVLAESGGDPNAHNTTPPDDSYGLAQINMLGDLGPARRKKFHITSNAQLFDPKTNMRAAFTIFKGSGARFTAWSTFTSGAYKTHLTDGSVPAAVVSGAQDLANKFDVGASINSLGETLFKGVSNITGMIVAVVLLVLGVVILLRNQIPAKKLIKSAISHGANQ